MKVQFNVVNGNPFLDVIADDGTTLAHADLSGTTRDGTARIERLAEKLQKAADKAADGSSYRYALRV